MWIKRVELNGFGNLSDVVIEFSRDKLNLVVANNEYGKSTLAEAIWAVIYNYPTQRVSADKLKDRDAKRPLSGGPFKASLDIECNKRSLRLVRDFLDKTLRVFDLGRADVEVTNEFLSGPTSDNLGFKLLGIERELFQKTCFVGQRELGNGRFEGDLDLLSHFQSIADSAGAESTASDAISIIEDTLNSFPYRGKKQKAERLVEILEEERKALLDRALRLESEHESVQKDLERLSELDTLVADKQHQVKSWDYFQLCMEAADIDTRLIKVGERSVKLEDLRSKLKELGSWESFPIGRLKSVEELWTKRASRITDKQRLAEELQNQERNLDLKKMELRERCEDVGQFSREDAQSISSLGRTLQSVLSELEEAETKLEHEKARVQNAGVNLDSLAKIRKTLLNVDAKDLDDAYSSQVTIKSAKERLSDCERAVLTARMLSAEIEQQRYNKRTELRNSLVFLGIFAILLPVVLCFLILSLRLPWQAPFVLSTLAIFVIVIIGLTIFLIMLSKVDDFRKQEMDKTKGEEEGRIATAETVNKEQGDAQARLETIARKAGVASGQEFVKLMESYASASAQLKDLDILEPQVLNRQDRKGQLLGELAPYFLKAQRQSATINPQEAFKLAEAINHYLDEYRALDSSGTMLEHQKSEIKFLSDEVRDIDSLLQEDFRMAKIELADSIETTYKNYTKVVSLYRGWQVVTTELRHLEQDTTSEFSADTLGDLTTKLQTRREEVWSRMEDMVSRFPEVAKIVPNKATSNQFIDLSAIEDDLKAYRQEQQDLNVHVRATSRDYDSHYLEVKEELETLEGNLERIKQAKQALELSKEAFKKMSVETHLHWSSQLNEISKEMLSRLNTDFEILQFDPDLKMTARRKGVSEPLQPSNIYSQLSIGTREQLFWLARMSISRLLSKNIPLPIILDEPFSEADDKRFATMMGFLTDVLLQEHQVIILSCHQMRHQWLTEQLNAKQRQLLHMCKLEPTHSDAPSARH